MTMSDDELLAAALRDAASAVAVPADGPQRILDAARATTVTAPTAVVQALLPRRRRVRLSLGAAALVVVAVAISLPLVQSPSPAPNAGHTTLGFGNVVPSTTIPLFATSGQKSAFGDITYPRLPTEGEQRQIVNGSGLTFGTSETNGASPIPHATSLGVPVQSTLQSQPAKVEADGTVSLTVARGALQRDLARLTALAASMGGYVASTHVQVGSGSDANTSSGNITLRVPEVRFGRLVTQVQRVGHVTAVRTTSTDVTSQYVDLQARIAALEISRQQYLTIMAKAHTVAEILAIQSQVNNIQSEIEQLKGERNALNNETAYGTLQVSLTQQGQQPNGKPVAGSGVGTAWHQSVRGFVVGVEGLIRVAGPTLFVLLCLLALFFLGRAAWRASRRRMI